MSWAQHLSGEQWVAYQTERTRAAVVAGVGLLLAAVNMYWSFTSLSVSVRGEWFTVNADFVGLFGGVFLGAIGVTIALTAQYYNKRARLVRAEALMESIEPVEVDSVQDSHEVLNE